MTTDHEKPFVAVSLPTKEGMVHAHHYVVPASTMAVVLVGRSKQQFDSPAGDLFPRLAKALKEDSVTTLQVALCNPENPDDAIHDVRCGIQYLCGLGSKTVLMIGYDIGADAVWSAAESQSCVRGIALLQPKHTLPEDSQGRSVLVFFEPGQKPSIAETNDANPVRLIEMGEDSLDARSEEIFQTLRDWVHDLHGSPASQAA